MEDIDVATLKRDQLIFHKGQKQFNVGRKAFSITGAGATGHP
jgi:hypothetical protein